MFYKPHPHVNAWSLKSEVRYFDRMCKNLDTKPKNIAYLIRCISRAFYAREIRAQGSQFRYNLSDAYYLAKVLCMIKHRLISNRLFTQLNVMFDLSVNLFCDIVFFTDIVGTSKRRYMQKHKRIIQTFYSIRDMFHESASESDWLYYMFSIFCSPHTLDTRLIL